MDSDTFFSYLHDHPEKLKPVDWEVDWNDAPLPYKQYQQKPFIRLSREIPENFNPTTQTPNIQDIGHLLWYVYGMTKVVHSAIPIDKANSKHQYSTVCRKFVPSGGALYPNEIYLYLQIKDIPKGVYHYDVAQHALVLLREGDFAAFITDLLGKRGTITNCFATVFLSTLFWKNFFKYHNFAYRLQGLDSGVVIGQLLECTKQVPYQKTVYYQFLDKAANHLLGLTTVQESVYAIITLSADKQKVQFQQKYKDVLTSETLCRQLPTIHHDYRLKSKKIHPYPLIDKIHTQSLQNTTQDFTWISPKKSDLPKTDETIPLSPNRESIPSFYTICKRRTSPGMNFTLKPVTKKQLTTILQTATEQMDYVNDLSEIADPNERIIAGYFHHIEDIPNGLYVYDSEKNALSLLRRGDFRTYLQQSTLEPHINIFQVPICLHIFGKPIYHKEALGVRGYRTQQMQTGILVQRLALSAASIGFGAHPLLGFDTKMIDFLYSFDQNSYKSLIQIPIGPFQSSHKWEGILK
ncbi:SagB family peptide dehydrogenase [Shimazuella sp. AN120528]|uniref:SagB family peptide dehydrogenase n=1 Tax=Shimazuella soli TaxID=1892854 RepID=UPI001F0F20E4|nr:SagB family peptide dehydrogenase [Shimazuella soli]MCH5584456.1 SagB family peptide dehydrogenase [Shimazuella soli]